MTWFGYTQSHRMQKFEFRLGNFGTKNSDGTKNISLSPFAYSYNDLIKSPQGKLVKAGN